MESSTPRSRVVPPPAASSSHFLPSISIPTPRYRSLRGQDYRPRERIGKIVAPSSPSRRYSLPAFPSRSSKSHQQQKPAREQTAVSGSHPLQSLDPQSTASAKSIFESLQMEFPELTPMLLLKQSRPPSPPQTQSVSSPALLDSRVHQRARSHTDSVTTAIHSISSLCDSDRGTKHHDRGDMFAPLFSKRVFPSRNIEIGPPTNFSHNFHISLGSGPHSTPSSASSDVPSIGSGAPHKSKPQTQPSSLSTEDAPTSRNPSDWGEFLLFLSLIDAGNHDAILRLLQCGQTLNKFVNRSCARQRDGERVEEWTALHTAAARNTPAHARIVALLLDHGAVGDARTVPLRMDYSGRTALHIACQRKCHATIKALLTHPSLDPNVTACEQRTTWAASNTDLSRFFTDRTPLHVSVELGDVRAVKMLIAHGANPDAMQLERVLGGSGGDRWRETLRSPLHLACRAGKQRLVNALAPHCDLALCEMERHGFGYRSLSPLHIACERGDETTAMTLLAHGADILQTNEDGDWAISLTRNERLRRQLVLWRRWRTERVVWLGQRYPESILFGIPDDVLGYILKLVEYDTPTPAQRPPLRRAGGRYHVLESGAETKPVDISPCSLA